jgi:hypothetical protein
MKNDQTGSFDDKQLIYARHRSERTLVINPLLPSDSGKTVFSFGQD